MNILNDLTNIFSCMYENTSNQQQINLSQCIISCKEYIQNNYISKNKINQKIQNLIIEGNYKSTNNPHGRIHFIKEHIDYKIEILKELLEEE